VDQKNDRAKPEQSPPAEPQATAPRKRFRIERIEERIAPTKGGNSKHGGHQSGASGSFTGSLSSY
jgi:hypothetical protein